MRRERHQLGLGDGGGRDRVRVGEPAQLAGGQVGDRHVARARAGGEQDREPPPVGGQRDRVDGTGRQLRYREVGAGAQVAGVQPGRAALVDGPDQYPPVVRQVGELDVPVGGSEPVHFAAGSLDPGQPDVLAAGVGAHQEAVVVEPRRRVVLRGRVVACGQQPVRLALQGHDEQDEVGVAQALDRGNPAAVR